VSSLELDCQDYGSVTSMDKWIFFGISGKLHTKFSNFALAFARNTCRNPVGCPARLRPDVDHTHPTKCEKYVAEPSLGDAPRALLHSITISVLSYERLSSTAQQLAT